MENIAIFIYDLSLLGGCQKVSANLVNLFEENNFPIKTIICYEMMGDMEYKLPSTIKIVDCHRDMSQIRTVIKQYGIGNLIVQVEKLSFCYRVINSLSDLDINILPVIHIAPFYYIKKYYSLGQYCRSFRKVLQWFKMIFYWRYLHMSIFRKLSKKCIICVSEEAKRELEQMLNLPNSSHIACIYNPLDFEWTVSDSEKQNILTYVGRLSEEKRTMLMLKVWKTIAKKVNTWKFYIIGDGPDRAKMERYVVRHAIKNVVFTGRVNNVKDYLEISKISILLSKYEGLGTGMLEACAKQNTLVGCLNDGGLRDIVENQKNGFLVKPKVQCVAASLYELMANEKLCAEMAHNSQFVLQKFNKAEILQKWSQLLV